VIAAVTGTVGGVDLKAIYGVGDVDVLADDLIQYGVSASYTTGALRLDAFYSFQERGTLEAKHIGVGATYDLGGGAAIEGGIVSIDDDGILDAFLDEDDATLFDGTVADIGVTFRF
jgi:outer membrane protein OmpU